MSTNALRVLIVAEHASMRFGGEAALPVHYFRILRQRGLEAWLVVHERTRDELKAIFPEDFERIHFVPDTVWHRILCQCSKLLPQRLGYFTFGLALRLLSQIVQRRIVKQLVREQRLDIVHQPIPVSPKEPSMIFGLDVPVVIGPMNGGMDYPPAFRRRQSPFVDLTLMIGRLFTNLFNTLIPGKRLATVLLVANSRTQVALLKGVRGKVIELVENGVDLSIWNSKPKSQGAFSENVEEESQTQRPTRFIFLGRLVDWKAVDLLLIAYKRVVEQVPVELEIIGEGSERAALEEQARELGLTQLNQDAKFTSHESGCQQEARPVLHFSGWLSPSDCAQRLHSADVLVLPSLLECGGAVVLEAMATELPVIATNWGGPTDYLDESCGILIEPTSRESFIDELANAMLKMGESPELRQVMGKAGRQRVIDCFDWEVKVDKMLDIYQEAINIAAQETEQYGVYVPAS
jgi:glycosyltransferase involved in cell wall biosynthesis